METRALIYVRRSMVRYKQDRASPERQLASCVRVCEEKGWRYEVYQDAEGHRSGRSEKHRPDRASAICHTQVSNLASTSETKSEQRGIGGLVLRKRRARRDSNPRSHRFEVCGSIH